MSNILTYTLQLSDKMTALLNKIGMSSDSTSKKVDELEKKVNSLDKKRLSGISGSFSEFSKSVSKLAGVLGIGATLGKTIKMGMEQEMRSTSFEVLFGGVDNAKKMIDDISSYAATSPYGKAGLSEATQMMAGFGIAQDKIIPNLRMIGDIAMGDEQKFKSLSLAFSQMSSTGKLTGQDLMQMINVGFNPLEQMAKTTGKSIGALKEEMSKGAISADMVSKAFYDATQEGGLYHGMIDKISNTVGGQWATAQDNLSEKLLNLYSNVLQPVILPALKLFNDFLNDPINTISRLADKVTSSFPIISAAVIAVTSAFVAYKTVVGIAAMKTMFLTAKAWLLDAALAANPVGIVIAAIVALIAVIAFLIIKIDGWGKAWEHTVNGAKLIFQAFTESVKWYFNSLVDGIMIGLNYIQKAWYSFKEAVGIGDSSENQSILAQINADTEARKQAIVGGAQKVAELGKAAAGEFKNAAGSLSWNDTSLSDVTNGVKNKLGISSAGVPGTQGISGFTGTGNGGGGGTGVGGRGSSAGKVGKDTANSIATGGTKTTHVTINISEMGNDMKIYVNSIKEGAANMRDTILDEMTRVLSMAQSQL